MILLLLLFFTQMKAHADPVPNVNYSPKLSLRMANGILQSASNVGGSSLSLAGLNLSFHYFLNTQFSLGLGYRADFDFANSDVAINGFFALGRWYFKGKGTRVHTSENGIESESRDDLAFYTGFEVSKLNYFLGSNTTTLNTQQTGDFVQTNILVGGDLKIAKNLELTGEINYSLFSFSGSDDRYRIKNILLLLGISYIW